MAEISEAALEAWIAEGWPHGRPPWHRSVFVEMMAEEKQARAKEWAKDHRNREVVDLVRRVARLERTDKRDLHLRGTQDDFFEGIRSIAAAVVAEELAKRGPALTYRGVWDEAAEYPAGSMATHAGSSWVAIAACARGEKPGKAPGWRLCAKGDMKPGVA